MVEEGIQISRLSKPYQSCAREVDDGDGVLKGEEQDQALGRLIHSFGPEKILQDVAFGPGQKPLVDQFPKEDILALYVEALLRKAQQKDLFTRLAEKFLESPLVDWLLKSLGIERKPSLPPSAQEEEILSTETEERITATAADLMPVDFPPPPRADLAFWAKELPKFWQTCYVERYLTAFTSAGGEAGWVVSDPFQEGKKVSEAVGYGMIISSGIAALLASTGNQKDLSRAGDYQEPFDKLVVGFKEMERLGRGLPAWKVMVTAEGKLIADTDPAYNGQNSATDAEQDIWLALTIAAKLVEKGIWKQGKINYKEEAAALLEQIEQKEVKAQGGRLVLLPSEDWHCDDPDCSTTAIAVNPTYVRVGYYLLSAQPLFGRLAKDSFALFDAVLAATENQFPDWIRLEVAEGEYTIGASASYPENFTQYLDGARWPMSIWGGGERAKKIATAILAGRDPWQLTADWIGSSGLPKEVGYAMGFLAAVCTEDQKLVADYGAALKRQYKKAGYFSHSPEVYYNNSLGAVAVIFAYLPLFLEEKPNTPQTK